MRRLGDNYGHAPTDEVLKEVGGVFQQHALSKDKACRCGGDEFLLIVPQTTSEELRERADHIKQAANKIRVHVNGQPCEKIRLSVGIAIWPIEDRSLPAALHSVEALLYLAEQDLQRVRNQYLQKDLL